MKKNVLVFGTIGGLIVAAMMFYSTGKYCATGDFEGGMIYGYTAMILAFSMIFVAVKNFRDKYNNGVLNFGKAFKIGFYITLIASTIYVISWLINYYCFIPDFMDKYSMHMIAKVKASGVSAAEVSKEITSMDKMKEMYKNPLFVILFTYLEILPVGLVVALISAGILKRKTAKAVTTNS